MADKKHPPWISQLADIGMVFFGLIMMVTPLALWVAPTKPWFYFVLKAFVISAIAVCLLAGYETSAADAQNLHPLQRKRLQTFWRFILKQISEWNRPSGK